MSPSEYGKTNNYEAFAEAYQTLMENGLDYRLSNNSEENIDKNRLFEYIAEMLKSKNSLNLNFHNYQGHPTIYLKVHKI